MGGVVVCSRGEVSSLKPVDLEVCYNFKLLFPWEYSSCLLRCQRSDCITVNLCCSQGSDEMIWFPPWPSDTHCTLGKVEQE